MVSANAKIFREAQQISVILLILIFILIFGQAIGSFSLGPLMFIALTEIFVIADVFLFYISVKTI